MFLAWSLHCISYMFANSNECFDDNPIQSQLFLKLESQFTQSVDPNVIESTFNSDKDHVNAHNHWETLFDGEEYYLNHKHSPALKYIIINAYDNKNSKLKYSMNDIYNLSNGYKTPILFKGILRDTFAVNNWNESYLINNFNEYEIPFHNARYGYKKRLQDVDNCEEELLYNKYKSNWKSYFDNNKKIIKENKNNMPDSIRFWPISDNTDTREKLLENGGLFDRFESDVYGNVQIAGMFGADFREYNKYNSFNDESDEYYISADFHSEVGPFLFASINGLKVWRMIPSEFLHLMKPVNHGVYTFSHTYKRNNFNLIPKWIIPVNKTDMLFIPPWAYHEVYTRKVGMVMATGLRMFDFNSNMKSNPYLTLNTLGSILWENTLGKLSSHDDY